MKILVLIALLACLSFKSQAAPTLIAVTNYFLPYQEATNAIPTNLPYSTSADIAKVLSDFGIHVSLASVGMFLAVGIPLVNALARYARKAIPDNAQVNSLGLALAHVAGEVNPSIAKLAAEAASPSAQIAIPATQAILPPAPPKV
jgi:hypothetical protein